MAFKPKEWFFEGQNGIGQYDERSLANILKQALEKAKISKPVSLIWLHHCFATHLLENGTDLRYIQVTSGHSRSAVTAITPNRFKRSYHPLILYESMTIFIIAYKSLYGGYLPNLGMLPAILWRV